MVGAGLPQHVLAAHALEAAQDVLQRVVERVAHVQGTGHVRRRDHDGEGSASRRSGRPARNACARLPGLIDAAFNLAGWKVFSIVMRAE